MNTKGNMMAGVMVTLILVVLVTSIVFSFISSARDTTTVTDDQFTASNTTCVQITDNCIVSLISMENATGTGTIGLSNFSICTVKSGGGLQGVQISGDATTETHYTEKLLNATYISESCQKITGMTSTMIGYLPLLMAVAILVFVAFLVK